MSSHRLIALVLGFTIVAALGVSGWFLYQHRIKTNPQLALKAGQTMPVRVATVSMRTLEDVIGASGQTREFESVTLTARVVQPITRVTVSIGDRVQRGQLLMAFDTRVIEASVKEARERVSNAQSALQYAELNHQRQKNLYEQQLIARVDVEQADAAVKNARLDRANAELQLEKSLQDLANTTISSPVDGIVLDRPVNAGETPRLDNPLITIGLIDTMMMVANISESRLTAVRSGQAAAVVFESFRNEVFDGELVKIDPSVDFKTRTFAAYIKIPNPSYRLTVGMTGFARIRNSRLCLAVPSVAVMNPAGDTASVFVVNAENIVTIRRVNTGISTGSFTEILTELEEGERVVTAGIQYVQDGHSIRIMEDDEP